jgi:sulfatase modifying factor 1
MTTAMRTAAALLGATIFAGVLALRTGAGPSSVPSGLTVPGGMVYVPGGTTQVGAEDGAPDERPVHLVKVAPFFMDAHPVTVRQYRAFVAATSYRTDAERAGDAGVLDVETGEWKLVPGATWRRPLGPERAEAQDDHPVTQVSWNDAVAYATWAGKRLPTEAEWEHAARGARDGRQPYAWGAAAPSRQVARANTWQGPASAPGDGYVYTSPVGTFGVTELGLSDMGGNVWEWTADWYRPYADRGAAFVAGPGSEKAQRGGSFLCSPDYCHGYRVSARSHSTPETALFHIGFRCVQDIAKE